MEGSSGSSDATGAGSPDGAVEDAAARAERLFASLTDQAREQRGNGRVRRATPASEALPPTAPAVPAMADPPSPPATGAGIDRDDQRGGVTTSQLVALSLAVEQALEAVNSRLSSLEEILLGEPAPRDTSAELAVARLRRTLLVSGLASARGGAGPSTAPLDGDGDGGTVASAERTHDP